MESGMKNEPGRRRTPLETMQKILDKSEKVKDLTPYFEGQNAAFKIAVQSIKEYGWQPIESAPDTEILVWGGSWESELSSEEYDNDEIVHVKKSGVFFEILGGTYYSTWINNPTHWHPLPEPPKEGENENPK